jgi:PAS domain S-box-containing protein
MAAGPTAKRRLSPTGSSATLLASAALYFLWGAVPTVAHIAVQDPLWERAVLSGLCVVLAVRGEVFSRAAFKGRVVVALWAITAHQLSLVARNGLSDYCLVGAFILFGCAGVLLKTREQLRAYALFVLALTALCLLVPGVETWRKLLFALGVVTIHALQVGSALRNIRDHDEALAAEARARDFFAAVIAGIPDAVFVRDSRRILLMVNDAFCNMVERTRDELFCGDPLDCPQLPGFAQWLGEQEERALASEGDLEAELRVSREGRGVSFFTVKLGARTLASGERFLVGVLRDVTDRRNLELELQQAQKLEAVGRLAAGVAHEINTPIQFVSDNVHFLGTALGDLTALAATWSAMRKELPAPLAKRLEKAEEQADLDYLREHGPRAVERSKEGLNRVSAIVRSIKTFAHPDQTEMVAADLNQALESTLTIARNEYKYVADVETSFGALPPVLCHLGEINQVFLNVLVNAAHAIADKVGQSGERGTIKVATRAEADCVVISIADSGTGIPEGVRERIFDPFFTTKEVGRGTGQGLAISRSVVDKHHGSLRFATELGKGTTFFITLPFNAGAPVSLHAPARAEAAP